MTWPATASSMTGDTNRTKVRAKRAPNHTMLQGRVQRQPPQAATFLFVVVHTSLLPVSIEAIKINAPPTSPLICPIPIDKTLMPKRSVK
eukprot:CAMPEP_0179024878 /NCGR_PEP_ID=MMETSP0796-20121207/7683_1 /TAXON_ID=73915 /ORGANISM="Pyrodinium bahamense, Strain pbaha01" /LENGTH=88 /DNA_ID=CAMNT_0020720855 /DNA_START=422 /DNA_END=688 /DNA_ORIENTATION=+